MRHRPTPKILAVACTAAGLATLAPPALAAAPQLEQINRASGTAGVFGLTPGRIAVNVGPVTNDGRHSIFRVPAWPAGAAPGGDRDAIPGQGIWARDIVRNTTAKLTGDGYAIATGLDRTQRIVSFITSEALAGSADTNGKPDLYAYDPVTGLKMLVSRAGLAGKALGLTSYGAVTRGSNVAVFGTAQGVLRRDLLTGRTTRLGEGPFIAPLPGPGDYARIQETADQYVSNDGRTYVSATGIVSPSGVRDLPLGEESGEPVRPFVNEAGTILTWQSSSGGLQGVRQQDTRTGAITAPTIPDGAEQAAASLQRPTPDGSGLIVTLADFTNDTPIVTGTNRWDLATGKLTPLGPLTSLSRNERFGFTSAVSGAYLVGGTTGVKLPGIVDLPAATAYVTFVDRCDYVGEDEQPFVRTQQISPEYNEILPPAATARFRFSAGPGEPVVVDRTVAVRTVNDYDPSKNVSVPFANGAFRLDLTITLQDGRTISSRIDHAARAGAGDCAGL